MSAPLMLVLFGGWIPAADPAPAGGWSLLEAAPPASAFAAPQSRRPSQSGPRRAPPRGWIAVGAHWLHTEVDSPLGEDPDEDIGYGLDLGWYSWSGDLGFAVEGGVILSSFEIDTGASSKEDVDTTRYLIGVRFADAMEGSRWMPYARGGYMYREDDGDTLDDSGSGFYVGGGIEYNFAGPLSIAPQFLFTDSSSLDAQEYIVGATLTWRF